MDTLITLGRTLGFSLGAGVNLYATVAILGLAEHFGWVALPAQFRVFDNPYIIGGALVMYLVEFVADKIPWLDTAWDIVHTAIRPLGGALIAVAALGDASAATKAAIALLGGGVAASSHLTKAGTRAVANTSPEPFSNWILSLTEDGFVAGLVLLAITHPIVALAVGLVTLALILLFARLIIRGTRRLFGSFRAGQAARPDLPRRG